MITRSLQSPHLQENRTCFKYCETRKVEVFIFVLIVAYFAPNSTKNKALQKSCALNSFMTEVPIITKPVHRCAEQINGLVSI